MKKTMLSWLLTAALAATMILATGSSLALTYINPDPLTVTQGTVMEDDTAIRIGGDYGEIYAVKSSDNGIVMPGSFRGNACQITAIKPGTATLTISSFTTDADGSVSWHTVTMTVIVISKEQEESKLGSDSDVILNYGDKYTDTSEGYYQIIRYTTTNNTIATGNRKVDPTTGLEYPVINAGERKGECTISFFYRVAGQTGEQERKIKVTVVAPGTGVATTPTTTLVPDTSSTQTNTATATVQVGDVTTMTDKFYSIQNLKSSATATATAETTGSTGSMSVKINGIKAGTATVTFDAYTAAGSAKTTYTVVVTVKADTATTTDTSKTNTSSGQSDSSVAVGNKEKGVYLSVRNYKSAARKSFYAAVWIDGKKVVRTTDTEKWATLRWVSSDPKVFTVDSQTGKITTVAAGTAKLLCVNNEGTSCDAMTIVVS